jgi:hypothetical protein
MTSEKEPLRTPSTDFSTSGEPIEDAASRVALGDSSMSRSS